MPDEGRLVTDEPMGALDPWERNAIVATMARYWVAGIQARDDVPEAERWRLEFWEAVRLGLHAAEMRARFPDAAMRRTAR